MGAASPWQGGAVRLRAGACSLRQVPFPPCRAPPSRAPNPPPIRRTCLLLLCARAWCGCAAAAVPLARAPLLRLRAGAFRLLLACGCLRSGCSATVRVLRSRYSSEGSFHFATLAVQEVRRQTAGRPTPHWRLRTRHTAALRPMSRPPGPCAYRACAFQADALAAALKASAALSASSS